MRETGDLEALFVAERVVLASGESLRVWQKRLGQGGFGSVDKVSVPIVGLTVAVKTFKAVSFLNRSKLPAGTYFVMNVRGGEFFVLRFFCCSRN